jgi:hypothetical protein
MGERRPWRFNGWRSLDSSRLSERGECPTEWRQRSSFPHTSK